MPFDASTSNASPGRRLRLAPAAVCLLVAAFLGAGAGRASAHHPGSHASRLADGRVSLEAVAVATDACTRIASVVRGTPAAVGPPPGAAPVTARLERSGSGPCAAVIAPVRSEAVLDISATLSAIHLYVLAPDGSLASTERVPIR